MNPNDSRDDGLEGIAGDSARDLTDFVSFAEAYEWSSHPARFNDDIRAALADRTRTVPA